MIFFICSASTFYDFYWASLDSNWTLTITEFRGPDPVVSLNSEMWWRWMSRIAWITPQYCTDTQAFKSTLAFHRLCWDVFLSVPSFSHRPVAVRLAILSSLDWMMWKKKPSPNPIWDHLETGSPLQVSPPQSGIGVGLWSLIHGTRVWIPVSWYLHLTTHYF